MSSALPHHHHPHTAPLTASSSIICFYHSNINVSLINAHLCTHIIYTSIGIDVDGNITFPFIDDVQVLCELSFLEKIRKSSSENLKILISIGDKGENQRRAFNGMMMSQQSRKNFAKNIVGFCKKCNFDGIDLSWMHPNAHQTGNFSDLLRRIKELMHGVFAFDIKLPLIFENFNFGNNADPQILSATVNASYSNCYDIKVINRKVKFVNLMNFDMHDPSNELINYDFAVSIWLSQGASLNKLNIGVSTYEKCNDVRSIEAKATYARFGGFCGIAIHSFDGDDYAKGFPLIRAVRDIFEME